MAAPLIMAVLMIPIFVVGWVSGWAVVGGGNNTGRLLIDAGFQRWFLYGFFELHLEISRYKYNISCRWASSESLRVGYLSCRGELSLE